MKNVFPICEVSLTKIKANRHRQSRTWFQETFVLIIVITDESCDHVFMITWVETLLSQSEDTLLGTSL